MMANAYPCPHCGAAASMGGEPAGATAACPSCGKPISVLAAAPRPAFTAPVRRTGRWPIIVVVVVLVALVATCIGGGVFLGWFVPLSQNYRESSQRTACAANLERIALALDAYQKRHGVLPPSYLTDASGAPMHSWRVLLLPFLDEQELFDKYQLDQPWDSEENRKLLSPTPDVYACEADPGAVGGDASYLAVLADGGATLGAAPAGLQARNLDPTAVLVIVEQAESGVAWLEPRDLPASALGERVNDWEAPGISSFHLHGAHAVEDDGDVVFLETTDAP